MILGMIEGAALSAFLQVLFDRLATRQFIELFRRKKLDEPLLQRLKTTLLTINAVLSDAEEKQITNSFVKEWVDELKDATYEGEDLLDEIATALQCKTGAEKSNDKMRKIFKPDKKWEKFNTKLGEITSRLEHLAKQKDVLGLKESLVEKPSPRLPTTSLVDKSEVCGRKTDEKDIMRMLLEECKNVNDIPVIAIVGIGGVGKTTLAQLLYNDSRVQRHFSRRAWTYVSEEFDVFKVTKTILESVASCHWNFGDLDVIQVNLKARLTGQRFLLVLDDVWNENFINWDILKNSFKAAAEGSRIIVTTRSHGVASTMRAAFTYHLRPLSDQKDCWSVFATQLENRGTHLHRDLEVIGEEIVKKCRGLPLALKTVGSLLRSKTEANEWNKILNSKIWDLPIDKSNILPSLRLSYYYLPPHLKRCFAYCSIFPKGYQFEKEKLILLWMAEGFLQQTRNEKIMKEAGHEYFEELFSRSFFQQKSNGDKVCYTMHDLVNELAQFASGEFCFKFQSDHEPHDIPEKVRHFSYLRGRHDSLQKFEALSEVNFLRTFLPLSLSSSSGASCNLNKTVIKKFLSKKRCLRVLSLSQYKIIELPDILKKLKLLRYLDLSCTEIRTLPKSICFLHNLYTLILAKSKLEELPDIFEISKLLRYLDLSCTKIGKLPESISDLRHLHTLILAECSNLTKLPEAMKNLIQLGYLDVAGTKLTAMPPEFGDLKSLQTLTTFVVGNSGGSSIGELGKLLHLHGKLSILQMQNIRDATAAESAKLKDKKNIKDLKFGWDMDINGHDLQTETEVLEKLCPPENIEKIIIENYYGGDFPNWMKDSPFSNLAFLSLSHCNQCSSLPSLGQLSSLKELRIAKMEALEEIGPEFYGTDFSSINPFNSLRTLWFEDMPNWRQWSPSSVEGREFPSLQELHIRKCQKLTGNLPSCLPSLKSLHIYECRNLYFQFEDNISYTELTDLSIRRSCDTLISFSLGFFQKLECLTIRDCRYLRYISEDGQGQFIRRLEVSHCNNLELFCGRALPTPNLTHLEVSNCMSLRSIPELPPSLQELQISSCPALNSFTNGAFPRNLKSLSIVNCDHLTPKRDWGLSEMESLTCLEIIGGCSNMTSFPEEGLLPVSLVSLKVGKFPVLQELHLRGLQFLPSLESLVINSCLELQFLSEGRLPESLTSLNISECGSSLRGRCRRNKGEDWSKISHIRDIIIS